MFFGSKKDAGKDGGISKKVVKLITEAQKKDETAIDLNNQKLREWPLGLFQLPLKKLTLSKNQLSITHPQLALLKELRHIDLSKNELTSLDPTFCELNNLKFLHLSFNKLTSIPTAFKKLVSLEEVYIDNNELEFCETVFEAKNLVVLDLSFNKIVRISTEICTQLAKTKLETWYLNDNKLTRIPTEISTFESLKQLDISNNNITILPKNFQHKINNYSSFRLDGNPWQEPPKSVCSGGPQAIIAFFKEKEEKEAGGVGGTGAVGGGTGAGSGTLATLTPPEDMETKRKLQGMKAMMDFEYEETMGSMGKIKAQRD